jgi:nicotinate phosphoribosyltransferase
MIPKIRLDPATFKLTDEQIKKLQSGYYSDKYFNRTKDILIKDKQHPNVIMQIFQRKDAVVCGIDEAIAVLKLCLRGDYSKLNVWALHDGDIIKPWETVMTIEGDYSLFAHLETVYLGILARRTKVATCVKKIVTAANGKPILFFPARFDHWSNETGDGYAAKISGCLGSSTDANWEGWGGKGLGTIPHGLIAAYHGNTSMAADKFDEYVDPAVNRIVLVDFKNDCIGTTLEVVKTFKRKSIKNDEEFDAGANPSDYIGEGKGKIWGVRFDTSGQLRDKKVEPTGPESLGVCPQLIDKARKIFDYEGWQDLKIIVSGGFTEDKVKLFEKLAVPVDAYGVGSSLFDGRYDFTADVVGLNGKHCAKVGRKYNENKELEEVL